MTARRLPVLTCDGRPGGQHCQRAVWLPADTAIRQLQAAAADRGWQHHHKGRHYCGACAEAATDHLLNPVGMEDHT